MPPTKFGNRFSKINILRPGAVGAPRRYLTEITMPVMVDSEGKCVSFNFPSVAEGRVKLMGDRERVSTTSADWTP